MHTYDIDITTDDVNVFIEHLMLAIKHRIGGGRNTDDKFNTVSLCDSSYHNERDNFGPRYAGHDFFLRDDDERPNDEVLFTINRWCSDRKESHWQHRLMGIVPSTISDDYDVSLEWTTKSWKRLERDIRNKLKELEVLQPRLFMRLPKDEYLYQDEDITLRPGYRLVLSNSAIAVIQTITHFGK